MLIPKTILHVDDDPTMLRLVSRILSKAETTVISLSEPLYAIEKMAQIRPNIIILDIDMPEKDGMTLLQEIKKIETSVSNWEHRMTEDINSHKIHFNN